MLWVFDCKIVGIPGWVGLSSTRSSHWIGCVLHGMDNFMLGWYDVVG